MKRIILHWTAGSYKANAVDKKAYHFIVEGDGTVVSGVFPVSANAGPLVEGKYAAHCAGCNTQSIGLSMAAMSGAVESPFKTGNYPITTQQMASFVSKAAELSKQYNIPVSPTTILTHAEVEKNLGIKQKNKWDITYLPGYGKKTPKEIGDNLRQMITNVLNQKKATASKPSPLN